MPAGGREKMRYIVNSREMNLYDSRTIEEFHMPQAVLMERAALSFVETLRREKRNTSRTLVVCGSGNNGGDGYAIARMLMQAGNTVDVLEAPHTGKASVGNQLQKKIFLAYGGKILTEFPEGKSYTRDRRGIRRGIIAQCGGRIRIVNRPDECHGRGEGGG